MSSSSLIPTSNIKQIGSKVIGFIVYVLPFFNSKFQLGKSLLNLASLFTSSDTYENKIPSASATSTPKPRPKDTPIMPRRPPRRKLSSDRSRHKSIAGTYNLFTYMQINTLVLLNRYRNQFPNRGNHPRSGDARRLSDI